MKIFNRIIIKKSEYDTVINSYSLLSKANKALSEDLKDTIEANKELNSLKINNEILKEKNNDLYKQSEKIKNDRKELKKQNKELKQFNDSLIDKYENLLVKYNELNDKFEKFKKGKYIVKDIPQGRPPKSQIMKSKTAGKTSNIIKKLKEE